MDGLMQWCLYFGCVHHQTHYSVLAGGKLARDHVFTAALGTIGEETAFEFMHIHFYLQIQSDYSVTESDHSKMGGKEKVKKVENIFKNSIFPPRCFFRTSNQQCLACLSDLFIFCLCAPDDSVVNLTSSETKLSLFLPIKSE